MPWQYVASWNHCFFYNVIPLQQKPIFLQGWAENGENWGKLLFSPYCKTFRERQRSQRKSTVKWTTSDRIKSREGPHFQNPIRYTLSLGCSGSSSESSVSIETVMKTLGKFSLGTKPKSWVWCHLNSGQLEFSVCGKYPASWTNPNGKSIAESPLVFSCQVCRQSLTISLWKTLKSSIDL